MLPLLAGIHGMLCHDEGRQSPARARNVPATARGLLRMLTPQERGSTFICFAWDAWLTPLLQYARAAAMQLALRKAEKAHPRENAPKLGQIRSLGLLGHEDDSKEMLQK